MVVNPTEIDAGFIKAVFNWLCQFPERPIEPSFSLAEVVDSSAINRILKSILDDSISDFSNDFYSGKTSDVQNLLEVNIQYFEKLMAIINHSYVMYNSFTVSPKKSPKKSPTRSEKKKYQRKKSNVRVKKFGYDFDSDSYSDSDAGTDFDFGTKELTIPRQEDPKGFVLNYYFKFIIPKKLLSMPRKDDDLGHGDFVQIQALFSIFVEVGLRCKKKMLCETLISFLENADRLHFEKFFEGNSLKILKSSGTLESPEKSKSPRKGKLTIYDSRLNFSKDNSEEHKQHKELKERISSLESSNKLLKDELKNFKRESELYKGQLKAIHKNYQNYESNEDYINDISSKYLDLKNDYEKLSRDFQFLERKSQSEINGLKSEAEELKAECNVMKEAYDGSKESKKMVLLKKPVDAKIVKNQTIENEIEIMRLERQLAEQSLQSGNDNSGNDNSDYIRSLEWENEMLEHFYFTKQIESLRESEQHAANEPTSTLLMIKKNGREIHKLFVS